MFNFSDANIFSSEDISSSPFFVKYSLHFLVLSSVLATNYYEKSVDNTRVVKAGSFPTRLFNSLILMFLFVDNATE